MTDAAPSAGLPRVFAVDRDPHVARLLQQFFAGTYDVSIFGDGYSALDAARKAPPAAIVAEIVLPKLDGLALCRLLKSDPVTTAVPVLVLSVLASRDRAAEAGANAFLMKPLEKTRLVAALRALLETKGPSA